MCSTYVEYKRLCVLRVRVGEGRDCQRYGLTSNMKRDMHESVTTKAGRRSMWHNDKISGDGGVGAFVLRKQR